MPRKARITVPGAVHHVMSRGIEGRPIFRNDDDRRLFLNLLDDNLDRSHFLLYAWSLMDNHYHLVLRVNEFRLSVFMRRLNGRYAQYFRQSMETRGYLFQDRYKSIVAQDQRYVAELIRYVHINPLRAGVCADFAALERYPWCGHATLLGHQTIPFQNTQDVLKRFGREHDSAVARYRSFIEAGMEGPDDCIEAVRKANQQTEDIHHTGCWVIGNREFVQHALEQDRSRRLRIAGHAREGVSLSDIARKVANAYGIPFDALHRRGRSDSRSSARKAVAFIAHQQHGIPVVEVARFFGISSPSVSEMLRDGQALVDHIT